MKQTVAPAIVSLIALLLCSDAKVGAQQYFRPGIGNPYGGAPGGAYLPLAFARQGNVGNIYYSLIRPIEQANTTIGALGQQIVNNQQGIAGLQNGLQGATGHPSRFLNYQYYFMNTGAVAGPQGVVGGAQGARAGVAAPARGLGGATGAGGLQRPPARMP
jgi:hypothetical protein